MACLDIMKAEQETGKIMVYFLISSHCFAHEKTACVITSGFLIGFILFSQYWGNYAVIHLFHLSAHHRIEYAYNRGDHTKHGLYKHLFHRSGRTQGSFRLRENGNRFPCPRPKKAESLYKPDFLVHGFSL